MGTPLEKITNQEMKAIEMQILNCIDDELSGEPLAVSVLYLLREWNTQKQYLFDNVFGGELILSKHAVFTKNGEQIQAELDNTWDLTMPVAGKEFWRKFTDFCQQKRRELYGDQPWYYALTPEEQLEEVYWYRCEEILSNETLANNAIRNDFVINLPKPDGSFYPYKVQKGSRPIRVLNRLNKAFHFGDEEGLKELAIWQSRYLNDKHLEGEVCISIHPLDYMTMSENNCDWTSCMNWPESGCYRGGTIEMMNSPMVIVAYLKSKRDPLMMDLGWDQEARERKRMEWNSKKWRILICVNSSGIFSVKGYPYQHKELTQFVMEWIASLIKDRTFQGIRNFRPYRNCDLDNNGTTFNVNPRTYRMYNDFGTCDHYMMLDTNCVASLDLGEPNYCSFVYSGASECMHCGALSWLDDDNGVYFNGEGLLSCTKCRGTDEELCYCDLCGAGYPEGDMIWVGDTLVCPDCFENECFEDAWTYEYGFNDDSAELFIKLTNNDFTDNDESKPIEIGRCIMDNITRWIEEEYVSKYEHAISQGEVIVEEKHLNSRGHRNLERTLEEIERRKTWIF